MVVTMGSNGIQESNGEWQLLWEWRHWQTNEFIYQRWRWISNPQVGVVLTDRENSPAVARACWSPELISVAGTPHWKKKDSSHLSHHTISNQFTKRLSSRIACFKSADVRSHGEGSPTSRCPTWVPSCWVMCCCDSCWLVPKCLYDC